MIERLCKWCFQPIDVDADFVITEQKDYLHADCYREADSVIETSKNRTEREIDPRCKELIDKMLADIKHIHQTQAQTKPNQDD